MAERFAVNGCGTFAERLSVDDCDTLAERLPNKRVFLTLLLGFCVCWELLGDKEALRPSGVGALREAFKCILL